MDIFKNKLPEISKEVNILFDDITKGIVNVNNVSTKDFESIFDKYKITESREELEKFLKDWNGIGDISSSYQQWMTENGKSTSTFTTITKKASSVLKSFGAAMASMAINWAIGKVIDIAATAFDNFANASKHAAENAKELAAEMNESISSMSSNTSTLSDLNDEYQKLSKGVNQLGENISLSTNDYSRYKDIINQVSTIMPDLTAYFNAQGEKIAFAKGELKDLNKEYDEYIHNQAVKFVTEGDSEGHKIQNILDNYNNNESVSGFEKFWNDFKTSRGFGDIEDFTTREIINELEELKKVESIDEFKYLLNNVKYKYSHSGGRNTSLKYFIMEELGLTSKSRDEIESMTEANYNALMDSITSFIQKYEAKISSDMNQVRTVLFQEFYSKDEYLQIEDKDVRNDIIAFFSSIDSDIWDALNKKTDIEVSTFVNGIIESMSKNKEGFADAWNGLFNPELEDLPVNEYIQQIDIFTKTICKALGLDEKDGVPLLKVSFGFDGYDDMPRRFQKAVSALIDDSEVLKSDEYAELVEIVNTLKIDESELCLNAINDAENVTDAINGIKEALESIDPKADDIFSLSISQTVDQLNTQLKPAFDSLASAWNSIFTDDDFALNNIDILSTCDSIKSKLDNLNEIEGITVDYSSFEDFVRVLSNSESESEDVKRAFESLATSIAQAALSGTEDFETMKAALEDLGIANNEIVAFDALVRNTEALKEAGLDLADSGNEQIKAFAEEMVSAKNLTQAIAILTYQKKVCDLQGINTSSEVANLRTLAENAGYTGEVIQYLTELEQIYQQVESGTIDPTAMGQKIDRIVQLKTLIEGAANKIDYKPIEKNVAKTASSAGKSAAKSFTDILGKELAALDKKMEAGYIDFNDYIQARLGLIEDYYKQGKLSANEYYSYLERHYSTQLSYMDQVVNAVTRRIDAEVDALKQQKKDAENIYQAQIDSLEEEKTLLAEANQERQRQKNLQKSLYDMERARNQRTQLVYTEDRGMHYVADDQSIRDAQENVKNARYDIQIADIEKSISNLEEARDRETNAIDEMISNLETYKEAWNDLTSAHVKEQENLIAAQILGTDWEADILNSRLDVLNDFKNEYMSIHQAMTDAAWESANEQIKAAKEAEKGASGSQSNAPKIGSSEKTLPKDDALQTSGTSGGGGGSLYTLLGGNRITSKLNLKAYAAGTKNARRGLNLVGEDGAEAYFDNHGHVAIVTGPTLIPMEGGEVITPVQPGSLMWDLREKFNSYISKTSGGISSVMSPVHSVQRDMARMVDSISTVNNITNAGMRQVTVGDIHVTCPGVTSQEVARQVGAELNRQFSGFSLVALQESKKM